MKNALRSPRRWAGWTRTLLTAAALSGALGACQQVDSYLYGAREGTVEYPGSGAGPDAVTTYIARDKDTVDGIAQRFGVSTQSIVDHNRLEPPYTLRAGRRIEIKGAKPEASPPGRATATATVKSENLPPPKQGDPPRSAAPGSQPTPLTPPSTPPVTVAATSPLPKMAWPVRGKIVSSYGAKPDGQKNDGIDIGAAMGTPVKAADAGTVIYAGAEAPRMGNLLLVSHPGGYVTAYAHNEALLVKKGDKVTKGQTIARVGTSGGVPEPRLHFEVRKDNRTIDPAQVLQ
jgi:murein DD-endopeptidase MepM/ murein hydrolase activator NlpD